MACIQTLKPILYVIAIAAQVALATGQEAKLTDADRKQMVEQGNEELKQARACDDKKAEQFVSVQGETAEALSKAAFSKCEALWIEALNKIAAGSKSPSPSSEEIRINPYIFSSIERLNNRIDQELNIERFRDSEVLRLSAEIIEAKSGAKTSRP
ncbi:MAG: hypothetical protein WAK01_03165 [Methylocystis sp.]